MTRPGGAVTWGMARLRIRSGLLPLVVLVAVAAFTASCGGSPSTTGGNSTTSSGRSTTTSTNAQASGVLAAYRAEQAAFGQAVQQADPTLPALTQTMTGNQLTSVRRALVSDQTNGIVGRGTAQLNPKVVSIQGNQAVVHDCLFSSIELVYSATGKPVPPVTPPEHDGVKATLVQTSPGTWKVSDQNVTEGSCPAAY
jgi:hypothetical protein